MINWRLFNTNRGLSAKKYAFYFGNYDFPEPNNTEISRLIPRSTVGWGRRAVEMRANKTHFDRFENDDLQFTELMEKYKIYQALNKLKEDTLVAGCSFLALVGDRVLPFTAQEASGRFNWREQMLSSGVAAFTNDTRSLGGVSVPEEFVAFYKDRTIIKRRAEEEEIIPNPTGRPLIGLLTHHATTKRPFGNSVLVRPARDAIQDASRTLHQAMISAYLYNRKVDVLLGVDTSTEVEKSKTVAGDVLMVSPNDDGQIPKVDEFAQHAMTPFNDTLMISARNFCAATKLSLANLGISSDAPQSPEALEIVGDDLRDDIAEWHGELGQELKDFLFTIFLYENGITEVDANLQAQFDRIVPVFKPIYKSDFSKFGDAVGKIAKYAPNLLRARSIWRTVGLTSEEIDSVIESIPAEFE